MPFGIAFLQDKHVQPAYTLCPINLYQSFLSLVDSRFKFLFLEWFSLSLIRYKAIIMK